MPELFVVAGFIALAIGLAIVIRWRIRQRNISNAANRLVREHLRATYYKGDHVEAFNKGSRSSRTSKCSGTIVEPPFFKDDGKKIAIAIRSDLGSGIYIKPILELDDKGQWHPTQISMRRKSVTR